MKINIPADLKEMSIAMKLLLGAMANNAPVKSKNIGQRIKSGNRKRTKKGATHVVNPTARSRRLINSSPAQYRHKHLGLRKAKG